MGDVVNFSLVGIRKFVVTTSYTYLGPWCNIRAKGKFFMNRDRINALPLEDNTRAIDELIAELESNRHDRQIG